MVCVTVSAPVRPTEDPQRVAEAAARFFPGATVRHEEGGVVVEAADLRPLRQRVWELRIIDAFRGRFLHGLAADGRSSAFTLSKQAAFQGKVSFAPAPHPLGDLSVTVEVEAGDPWRDAEALAWWLAPETRDGEIVGPVED